MDGGFQGGAEISPVFPARFMTGFPYRMESIVSPLHMVEEMQPVRNWQ